MILKSYLFSKTRGVYQQYTVDQSEAFLKSFCKECSAPHQIAVHRNGNLMYYAYAYKNPNHEILGICIVCGELCLKLQWLYETFLGILDKSARKGVLFCYDEQGSIRKNVAEFSSEAAEVNMLFRDIKQQVELPRSDYWTTLPPIDMSIPLTNSIRLAFDEDGKKKINAALIHYHNVFVTMENMEPSSFAQTVKRLNKEKEQLQKDKEFLKHEISTLYRQKKQYRLVSILIMSVVVSLVVLFFMKNNLMDKIIVSEGEIKELEADLVDKASQIDILEENIEQKKLAIAQRNDLIQELNVDINSYKDSLRESERDISRLQSELSSSQSSLRLFKSAFPIQITNVEIANTDYNGNIETDYGGYIDDSYTMFLTPRITYIGIRPGSTINLKIKWYNPDGSLRTGTSSPSGYTLQESITVYSGNNTRILTGRGYKTKGHWKEGTYRIEIWYNDVCLKAKTCTIH